MPSRKRRRNAFIFCIGTAKICPGCKKFDVDFKAVDVNTLNPVEVARNIVRVVVFFSIERALATQREPK
jgi:hypothetical protein